MFSNTNAKWMSGIQLKVHIFKFNIHEYNFTNKFIDNQSE
jgi:hypothetical protein